MNPSSPADAKSLPDREALHTLAAVEAAPLVTLYVPFSHDTPGAHSNATAYAGAVTEACRRLAEAGVAAPVLDRIEQQLRAVESDLRGLGRPAAGVAVLHDRERAHAFVMPFAPPRSVRVADRFALRPLLAAVHRNRPFRLLALSAKHVALFEGDAAGLAPLPAAWLPDSLEALLGSEHSGKELRVSTTQAGSAAPRYYSHDSGREERKLDAERFHQKLARVLEKAFLGAREPLVLAAVETHQSGLRAAAQLPTLIARGVVMSPDHATPGELHAAAWPLVEAATHAEDAQLAAEYERAVSRGKGLHRIADVAAAAAAGRVRRLWVSRDERVEGAVDPASGTLVGGRPGEDVLDGIVTLALRHAADVSCGVPVPGGGPVAAELH